MEKRIHNAPEEYELESLEETEYRLEMIVRHIYYLAKDGESTGYTNHEAVTDFVNCLLYSALKFEKQIKSDYRDRPVKKKKVHGKSLEFTEAMKKGMEEQYRKIREKCDDRIHKA